MFARYLYLFSMVAALWVIVSTPSSAQEDGAIAGLAVVERQLVREVRVGRTHADYTYRIVVSNSGPARSAVVARVESLSAQTVIMDDEVILGDVPAGATLTSSDTFTLRQHRRVLFNPADLVWTFTFDDSGEPEPAPNTPPVADAGPDQTVSPGTEVILDGSASSDADGDPLSYAWVLAPPSGSAALLDDATAVRPRFVADVPGLYVATLAVNDGTDDSAPDTVRVSTVNSPPIADAGPDQTVPLGSTVILSGAGSSDPDGDSLAISWRFLSRPDDSSAALVSDNTVETSFVADAAGSYVIELVVNDGFEDSGPSTVTVSTENSRPVADPGPDQAVPVGALVTLDGSASSDADGDPLTFAWSFTSRPPGSGAVLDATDSATPAFVTDVAGLYVAQLIVNDGALDSAPDTVVIEASVPGDNPPQITSSPVTTAVLGEAYAYPAEATDPDVGDVLTWSLPIAPPGMTIDPASGLVTWTPPSQHAETVLVQVTDSTGLSDTQAYTIEVRASVDDQPPSLAPINDRVVVLGQTLGLVAAGSDPQGQPLRYSVAGPAGMAINSTTGELGWNPGTGQVGSAAATVSVTNAGGLSASTGFTVTVLEEAANTPPTLAPVPDQALLVGQALTVQLVASDPDVGDVLTYGVVSGPAGLTVDPNSGLLGWTPGPDQVGSHEVTAQVTDLAGAPASATFTVALGLPPVAPIAMDDVYGIKRGSLLLPGVLDVAAPGVLGNDNSPSGFAMSAELLEGPLQGSLTAFNADGSFSYTPDVGPPRDIEILQVCNSLEALGGGSRGLRDHPLVVDLDADGIPEIIWLGVVQSTVQMYAMTVREGRCELLWQTGAHGPFNQNPDYGILAMVPIAAGDVTGDGRPEIVAIVDTYPCSPQPCSGTPRPRDSHVALFDADGEFLWISEPLAFVDEFDLNRVLTHSVLHIADLTGDGRGEIVLGVISNNNDGPPGTVASMVVAFRHVEEADGTLRGEVFFETRGTPTVPGTGQHTAVHIVDLDLDGVPEILFENDVFSNTGVLSYSLPVPRSFTSTFDPNAAAPRVRSAIVNLDNDPFPEIVVKAFNGLYAFKHDGTEVWRRPVSSGVDAPITAADLTGDGWPEIAFQDTDDFQAWDRFGEQLWSSTRRFEPTYRHGSTAFDFNGNGRSELVISRTTETGTGGAISLAVILDGLTGEVVAEVPTTSVGGSARQIPVLADVTGDGQANLVVWQDEIGANRVIVLGGTAANPWGPARPIWNQNTYHATNINVDGTLPSPMRPHWLLPGLNAYHVNVPLPGEADTGSDRFTYRALAGGLASEPATVNIDITANINPPRIISTPVTAASPGFEYRYGVLAIDADLGDVLSFALPSAPAGMTISEFGIVEWTPTEAELGARSVSISVTDSTGLSDVQTFALQVGPPVLVPDLAGLAEADALEALAVAGLAAGTVSRRYDLGVDEGLVLSQALPPGSPAALGARVNLAISLGPQPLQVPNLAGLSRSVAIATLEGMGLQAGLVTRQNSDTMPRNQVLSQSVVPGQRILAGSTLDLVISSGPALLVELERELVAAGEELLFAVTLFDSEGNPQVPTPAYTASVTAAEATAGPAPLAGTAAVTTVAATRGEWILRIDLGTHTAELPFLVLGHAGAGTSLEPFAEFSSQLNAMQRELTALVDAIENGNLAIVPLLAANLQAIRTEVDAEAMRVASLMAFEEGFPPRWDSAALGTGPFTDGELAWIAAVSEAISDVETLEAFIETLVAGRGRNDDLRGAALVNAAADSLGSMVERPQSIRALLRARDWLWRLSSWSYPRAVLAGTDRVLLELDRAGLIAQVPATPRDFYARTTDMGRWQSPAAFYAQRNEVFFTLTGLMTSQVNIVNLAKQIYAPVAKKVLAASGPLATGNLLVSQVGATNGAGVITGASLSFHTFCVGNSILEARGFGPFAEQNTVTLVGPDQFNAAQSLADGLRTFNFVSAGQALASYYTAQANGTRSIPRQSLSGCFLDGAADCRQLVFPNGIESVYTDTNNPFPSPILFFIHNAVSGQASVITAPFFSSAACSAP